MKIETKQRGISDLANLSYRLYQLERYEEAFSFQEELISLCLRERNYHSLFIGIFNRNILLRILRHGLRVSSPQYVGIENYDLKEYFNNLPSNIQSSVEPLYNFLSFTLVYKMAYDISEEFQKNEKNKSYRENGGVILSNRTVNYYLKHLDILSFVLRNKIIIDSHQEFQYINSLYVKTTIVRQGLSKKITLEKLELYSCIKYIPYNELSQLLRQFVGKKRKHELVISSEDKEWLVFQVLENLSKLSLKSDNQQTKFNAYIENTLFILAIVKLEKEEVNSITGTITKIINGGKNTSDIFEATNRLIGLQVSVYNTEIDEASVLAMITSLISKFANKQISHSEYFALARNEIGNLYQYLKVQKVKFDNKILLQLFISELKSSYTASQQVDIGSSVLINLYYIGTTEVQKQIKQFLMGIDLNKVDEDYRVLPFELFLVINDFKKLEQSVIDGLSSHLDEFNERGFSSGFYYLKEQVEYLVEEKQLSQLENVLLRLKNLITRFEESRTSSILKETDSKS